jgi:Poly A polymerase head domain/Probable RNA and SrmB- binding site of polymerase A
MTGEAILALLRLRFRLLSSLPPSTYVVGGAVRDLLAGAVPGDLDIATADVERLADLLSRRAGDRPIRLGRNELTAIRIVDAGRIYDLTPLAGQSIESDLQRRDFAMNAIAIDCATGVLLDPFDGQRALEERRLTLVRESNLADDPLRVIKAVRMAVRYQLSIDEMTSNALRRHAPELAGVAVERVHDELMAILSEPDLVRGIELMRLLDLDQVVFGRALDPALFKNIAGVTFQSSAALALIHWSTNDAELHGEARRWRWSIAEERRVFALVKRARCLVEGENVAIVVHDLGPELAPSLAALLVALGERPAAGAVEAILKTRGPEILAMQPLLAGDEIIRLTGLPAGPAIGLARRALLEAQLRGEISTPGEAEILLRSIQS